MKSDNANSGSGSGATSAAAKPIQPPKSPDDEAKAVGKAGVGASAYLARQKQLATQAMSRALADAMSVGKEAVNPGEVAGKHPWAAMGLSAVAGFAAAALVVPSKEQQALRKLAKIERALNPQPERPKADVSANGNGSADHGEQAYRSGRSSLSRAIMGELIGALKPAVISLLTAGVTAATAKTSPEEIHAAAHGTPPPE